MRNIIRVELLIAILLLSFGSGMTSAVAGTNPVVSPKILKAPAVKTLPAVAKQYHYQAVARTQVLKSGQVRAGALSWQCQGSVCKISGPWPTPAVSACKALASQIGAIRSYGYSGHMLSAAQLEQCNAGIAEQARKPVAKGARQSVQAPVLAAPVAPAGSKKSQPKGFTPPSAPRTEQPKITAPQGGVAKSLTGLTGPGGKSPLPPQTNGPRVLMHDDTSPPPRLGGFVPGFVPPRVGDEIRRAPVTGPGGQPLTTLGYHLTAMLEILDEGGSRVLREVEPGQRIQVRLTVRNTGGRPSPRYKIISRRYGEHGPIDGLEQGASYQIGFRDVVGEDHMSGDFGSWFTGRLTARSTDGQDLIRSASGVGVDLMVPVRGFEVLSMDRGGISDVRLTATEFPLERYIRQRIHGHLHNGILESVTGKVTIFNRGNAASRETRLLLTLESTRAAVAPTVSSLIDTAMSQGGVYGDPVRAPQNKTIPVPSIPAHGQLSLNFNFRNVYYDLYELHAGNVHIPEAFGAYACGRIPFSGYHPGWRGSDFRITAVLQAQAAEGGLRAETMVAEGRFAVVRVGNCGVEDFSQRSN